MQVILKEDVANLGYKDDVVTVKSGYGRNYLIPQGKAVIASPSALKVREEDLKQRAHKLEKIKADALALAAALEGVSLTIGAKTSSTGTIFGSVNNIQIAEALEKLGHIVDRKQIVIKDTVKEVKDGYVVKTINRECLKNAQTPQAFKTSLLLDCIHQAQEDNFKATDDAQLIERYSHVPIRVVKGSYDNIKITTPEDVR